MGVEEHDNFSNEVFIFEQRTISDLRLALTQG